jgi:hypothetical protein
VLVNVAYSYAIVVTAAKSVQETKQWHEKEKIQNLVFSNKWMKNFLSRGDVSKRKITTEDKVLPTDEEIKRIFKIGQDMYYHFHNANADVAPAIFTIVDDPMGPEDFVYEEINGLSHTQLVGATGYLIFTKTGNCNTAFYR